MKKKFFSVLRIVLFLFIGFFFIWIFIKDLTEDQKREIFHSFRTANYWWVLLSIVFGVLSHVSRSIRWKMMMEPMGFKPRLKNVILSIFIGYFANLAVPRLGEMLRCGVLAKYEKIPFNKSFGTVITERAIDMGIFLGLFILVLFLYFSRLYDWANLKIIIPLTDKIEFLSNPGAFLYLLLGIGVLFIVLFFIFRRRLQNIKLYKKITDLIKGVIEGVTTVFKIKRPFRFIFHTFFIWGMYWMMTWVVFRSLPETAHLDIGIGLIVLVMGSIAMIVVQGGIGIYPAIIAEALTLYFIVDTSGYALGWILWGGQTIMIILMGIISMVLLPIINHNSTIDGKAAIDFIED